jgi:5-methylcytosine-specific restriction protein A
MHILTDSAYTNPWWTIRMRTRKVDRGGRDWAQLQRSRRRRAYQLQQEPLCRICLARGLITPATVADHIKPHRGDWNEFRLGPLQSLCAACHSEKTRRERGYRPRFRYGFDGMPLPEPNFFPGCEDDEDPEDEDALDLSLRISHDFTCRSWIQPARLYPPAPGSGGEQIGTRVQGKYTSKLNGWCVVSKSNYPLPFAASACEKIYLLTENFSHKAALRKTNETSVRQMPQMRQLVSAGAVPRRR